MPPRALDPSGLVLIDKPAGPSSFAVVADVRRRTGARTGHAGTLDPFATGLLLVLSGSATKLAQRFVGLDKRYLTDVDLTARTDDRRPRGRRWSSTASRRPSELEERLEALRGEIELPIPAASAVKIGGERAYKLHRQGVAVEMPVRRSRVDALDLVSYDEGRRAPRPARQLRDLRARDRDGARRPLPNAAADRGRAVPGRGGRPRAPADRRGGARASVNVARQVDQLEPKARAVALGTFDGVHLGHRRVLDATLAAGRTPTVVTFDPHPREALGYGVELLVPLGAAARAARRGRNRGDARRRLRSRAGAAAAGGVRRAHPAADRRRSGRRRLELPLRPWPCRRSRAARGPRLRRQAGAARGRRLVDADPRLAAGRRDRTGGEAAGPPAGDRRHRRGGRRARRHARLPDREPAAGIRSARPRLRDLRGRRATAGAPRSRSARTRTTAAASAESRRSCSTSRATSTASACVLELWQRLRDEQAFESEAELVAQIDRDVEATRQAQRP